MAGLKSLYAGRIKQKMHNFNILIVEDESLIALELADTITNLGYHVVEYATHPEMARQCIRDNEVHLILMDINLEAELSGIELYKSLECDVPVVYLTAYKDEETMSRAIETNPLGYLIKPHKEDELKALLKLAYYKLKSREKEKKTYPELSHLGAGYYFDFEEEKLYFNDLFLNLGDKELQLLKLLIHAKGSIVTFKTIENEVWREKVVTSSAMRTLIYRLRGKLEYKLIETIFNQGVKLNGGL